MSNENREVTREELKTNALLERIAMLENEKADLRVEVTIYANNNDRLIERIKELEALVPQEAEEDSGSNGSD